MKRTDHKLRAAVVGAGYLGRFHAEKYAALDDVDLVGVVDIIPERAQAVSQRLETTPYTQYRDLFGKVDAVSIVTPTSDHYQISREFLLNGVNLLIEKPITTTLAEADELIQLAEQNGLNIQVGHLERFNPAVVALQDVVEKPMFIESHRLSVFKDRATDVSVVLDLMIHDIDIILNFVGSGIKDIRASGVAVISEHVDIANARLEFDTGCVANVTSSRISMKNQRKIRMFQRNAYISVDFANREIVTVQHSGDAAEGLIPGMRIDERRFDQGDALAEEIRSFVRCVQQCQPPKIDGVAGRNALEVALSIMDQIQENTRQLAGQLA